MQQIRIAAPYSRKIQSLDIENSDLLTDLSSMFLSSHKLVTHIGIFALYDSLIRVIHVCNGLLTHSMITFPQKSNRPIAGYHLPYSCGYG